VDALVKFLRDRLDWEERVAQWAEGQSPRWFAGSAYDEPNNPNRGNVANGKDEQITGDTDASYVDHITILRTS
jgi:hypothetical protein